MRHLILDSSQAGEVLRARRIKRRLSQQALATQLHISQGRLSVLEASAGDITLDRLLVMARLLGFELVLQDIESTRAGEW